MNSSLSDEAIAVLAEERACLIEGRLDGLATIVARKRHLLERLTIAEISPESLSRLAEESRRNQRLILAATEGARAAVNRLRSLRYADEAFNCYSSEGRRIRFVYPLDGVERRA